MAETQTIKAQRSQAEAPSRVTVARRFMRRRPLAILLGASAILVLAAIGYVYWEHSSHFESTDDAFIDARQYSIAPKVGGYVTAVDVTDNQHVDAGAVIAQIEQRDYRIALADAEAQLTAAEARVQNLNAQIAAEQAQAGASRAQVKQSRAALRFAQQEAARSRALAQRGFGTAQREEQTSSALQQEQARGQSATETVEAANATVQSLKAQRKSAEASAAQAKAQVDRAKLNLSYTVVTVAEPGRVVRLTAAVGALAQPGTSLCMFVPDNVWVTANFKETQLDQMRPGQPAEVRIDAYPDRDVNGSVVSIQPGSGTAFSLLPAENATGNYVKIVQRVPVKIVMHDPPKDVSLGPGMSVVPTVRVNAAPSVYERISASL
ncbi:HlyD family secretion protein [Methylocystis sp. MJC1]|uniref:HlyD family secretion protein n=1 Tax=Methylocystis sp. MJC1 TaxID=2654282 RepID=UPI0013ED77F1|nr:HlyD family secretion protein [Methylocystis sp. MJC1]KAF2989996.1 putative multidrug resistance protein EmrK [Methylocystis sp. MJC1]MBU6528798.1 HlyD family secretion protein [Methylocystis sp. MJC1]UZX11683.1 HlyD family secretion protein [Methylocystis sp. MJC1]